jgi:hypothetical protein
VTDTNDSVKLVGYRSVLGLGVHHPNVFLDGFLGCDVGDGLTMMISSLVLFFHPLDHVGVVEGL